MIFRTKANIERPTEATSASGDSTVSAYSLVALYVDADIQPRSGNLRQQEYGLETPANFAGFFRTGTPIAPRDHVVVGSTRYLVTFVGIHGNHIEADLAQV